ncbi:MAG: hypothetical protein AAFQ53_10815 [Bacteroidota bacterium]
MTTFFHSLRLCFALFLPSIASAQIPAGPPVPLNCSTDCFAHSIVQESGSAASVGAIVTMRFLEERDGNAIVETCGTCPDLGCKGELFIDIYVAPPPAVQPPGPTQLFYGTHPDGPPPVPIGIPANQPDGSTSVRRNLILQTACQTSTGGGGFTGPAQWIWVNLQQQDGPGQFSSAAYLHCYCSH